MKDNVFVMASVRHPVQHFLSLYSFTKMHAVVEILHGGKLNRFDGMRMMLRNPGLIQNAFATLDTLEKEGWHLINLIRGNLQLFSLGINTYDISTILERTKEIDFFVITERYDESMIVLRDKLCCNTEDLLYRQQNVGRASSERKQVIPDDIRDAILEYNKGDLILYKIATQRLACDTKNETYMKQELKKLNYEQRKIIKKCMDIPNVQRPTRCSPMTGGSIPVFLGSVKKEQRKKLLRKLKEQFKSRENSRKDK